MRSQWRQARNPATATSRIGTRWGAPVRAERARCVPRRPEKRGSRPPGSAEGGKALLGDGADGVLRVLDDELLQRLARLVLLVERAVGLGELEERLHLVPRPGEPVHERLVAARGAGPLLPLVVVLGDVPLARGEARAGVAEDL